jgi:signal transduction histidine kinase
MVNDMLDLSSLEAGKIKLRTSDFALDGVVQEVLASLQPLAREKNLTLTFDSSSGAMVLGDRDRVKQILINLIGNSLKFTDTGSIRVSSASTNQFVKVFVSNTGPSMTPEQQKRLFKKFEQLGTRASGTGLGLHVSRELARAMGGDLWLEKSVPKEGTTFAFSLPLANLTPLQ